MTDDTPLLRDTSRAVRAQALMNDDMLQEAFAVLEKAYTDEWRITQARDNDARERLWLAVNVLGKVKDHLSRVLASGKVAQKQLDDLENRSKLEQVRRAFRVV